MRARGLFVHLRGRHSSIPSPLNSQANRVRMKGQGQGEKCGTETHTVDEISSRRHVDLSSVDGHAWKKASVNHHPGVLKGGCIEGRVH